MDLTLVGDDVACRGDTCGGEVVTSLGEWEGRSGACRQQGLMVWGCGEGSPTSEKEGLEDVRDGN